MEESEQDAVRLLLEQVPEFEQCYKKHMEDQEGGLLGHVLFGDFTRFAINHYRKAKLSMDEGDNDHLLMTRIFKAIEVLLSLNDYLIDEIVSVSFLENLHQAGEDYEPIKSHLGPIARRRLSEIENWRPAD